VSAPPRGRIAAFSGKCWRIFGRKYANSSLPSVVFKLNSASAPDASMSWTTAMRLHVILAVAAFALAGCNANRDINPSSQAPSQVFAGHYEDYNPYDPISYAQNNTGRGGGR
jgi:hypothetical protein